MSELFFANQPVGDIVVQFPTAGLLFKQYRIDFCCGGDRPLAEAAQARGVEAAEVLQALNEMYRNAEARKEQGTDWQHAPYTAIVDHVVATHHAFLKKELSGLGEFVSRIRNVHGSGHRELFELDQLYHALKAELEEHLAKEEAEIFPLVKQYAENQQRETLQKAVATIEGLEAEHSACGELLSRMRDITDNYTLPADACPTYTVTFQKLEELEDDMFRHIHLENNILFPRLEKELMS